MPGRLLFALGRIFFDQATTWRLLIFSVLGYAFSLAVILCTLGLMDGFESTLKQGLRLAAGDAQLTHRNGFFRLKPETLEEMQLNGVRALAQVVQAEAFALSEGRSQGVLVRGIDPQEFQQVTGMALQLHDNSIAIGTVLAREWSLAPGDELTIVLAKGSEADLPQFLPLVVSDVVKHGIYEKDQRLVYVSRATLQATLGVKDKVNLGLLTLSLPHVSDLEAVARDLHEAMGNPWFVKPAWQEFSGLLEAVAVEKTSIAIVLQLIVLVAVFNVAAFLITLQARKTREFFLLRSFGLPRARFFRFAALLLLTVWASSCLGAVVLVNVFNWMLANVSWLQVPGDVYVLTQLQVLLAPKDYVFVFGLALLWMAILGGFAARKIRQKSLMTGLRQEFQ